MIFLIRIEGCAWGSGMYDLSCSSAPSVDKSCNSDTQKVLQHSRYLPNGWVVGLGVGRRLARFGCRISPGGVDGWVRGRRRRVWGHGAAGFVVGYPLSASSWDTRGSQAVSPCGGDGGLGRCGLQLFSVWRGRSEDGARGR